MSDFGTEGFIFYLPLFAWIGVILLLSSGNNSVSRTFPFFVRVLDPMLAKASSPTVARSYIILRKIGHLVGYAILDLLASAAFSRSSAVIVSQYWHVLAFAVTLAVAAADETRQHFDPDRVGSIRDVALDCIGGVASILLFWIMASQ